MDLSNIFKDIKKKFSPRKLIDFEEENLHFEVEPLNSLEEMVIMGALQDIEGTNYIKLLRVYTLACAIKKINDVEITDEVKYMDGDGEEKVKSHFLFMKDYVTQWPSELTDIIFEAYANMLSGLQKKIRENAKFEKVSISDEPEDEAPEKFHKIDEESNKGLTETERLNKRVEEEISNENLHMAEAENKALKS